MSIKVNAYGVDYQCAKAVKGDDYIYLFDNGGQCIASFEGITDFTAYQIIGGSWVNSKQSNDERIAALEDAITELMFGGAV